MFSRDPKREVFQLNLMGFGPGLKVRWRRIPYRLMELGRAILAILGILLVLGCLILSISGPDLLGQENYCNSPMGYRDVRCVGAFTLPMRPVVGR